MGYSSVSQSVSQSVQSHRSIHPSIHPSTHPPTQAPTNTKTSPAGIATPPHISAAPHMAGTRSQSQSTRLPVFTSHPTSHPTSTRIDSTRIESNTGVGGPELVDDAQVVRGYDCSRERGGLALVSGRWVWKGGREGCRYVGWDGMGWDGMRYAKERAKRRSHPSFHLSQ